MLTPEYIQTMPDTMVALYTQVETDILEDMARRISAFDLYIPSAQYQAAVLQEMGMLSDDIVSALSEITQKSTEELTAIMSAAASTTLVDENALYMAAGLITAEGAISDGVKEVLMAGLEKTQGLFTNLTSTTAATATQQFEQALDRAYMKVASGAFDSNSAVTSAIKELSAQGVSAITYPSGHTDSIETAVRRAVTTGVNQTCLQVQEARADELGVDLVEVTAHAGARPSHAEWQGEVYSRNGASETYPDLKTATGYGTGAGLGGWNCSHSFRSYIEGFPRAYTKEMLEDYSAKNYEYNGVKMTEYEANQQQRYIERNLRRWKQENIAMKAAGLDTTQSASKIAQWNQTQADFLAQTGLKAQASRTAVAGWTKSVASKASYDTKILQSMAEDAILKTTSSLPKKLSLPDVLISETVQKSYPTFVATIPAGAMATNVYAMAGSGTSNVLNDWKRLYNLYGGVPTEYQKLSGDVVTDNYKYVVHWYECNGKTLEYKISNVKAVKK